MKSGLVLLGVLTWMGVASLSVLMAEWGQPVWGYFPIVAAVLTAWAVGQYVSKRLARPGHD
jgi:hypothetical protein